MRQRKLHVVASLYRPVASSQTSLRYLSAFIFGQVVVPFVHSDFGSILGVFQSLFQHLNPRLLLAVSYIVARPTSETAQKSERRLIPLQRQFNFIQEWNPRLQKRRSILSRNCLLPQCRRYPASPQPASTERRKNISSFDMKSAIPLIERAVNNTHDAEIYCAVSTQVAHVADPKPINPPTAFEKAVFDTPLRPSSASQGDQQTHDEVD